MSKSKFGARFSKFFVQDTKFNVFVFSTLIINLALYIGAVYLKSIDSELSNFGFKVDFFKLFLVWSNILLMSGLLLQKKIGYSATWIKSTFVTSLAILNIGATLNLYLLVSNSDQFKGEGKLFDFQLDFLTLALTIFTDLVYLALYVIFKSKRAVALTFFIILIEAFIFVFCMRLGTDFAIDVGNLTISMATTVIALPLWGAKVVLTPEGEPLEWKGFFDLFNVDILVSDAFANDDLDL